MTKQKSLKEKMSILYFNRKRLCSSNQYKETHPCYKKITLSNDWTDRETFYQWLLDNDFENYQSCSLDKDILNWENQTDEYSADNCILIPILLNKSLVRTTIDLTIKDSTCIDGFYRLYFRGKYQGKFDNYDDYLRTYRYLKSIYLLNLFNQYKNDIPSKSWNKIVNSKFYNKLVEYKYTGGREC